MFRMPRAKSKTANAKGVPVFYIYDSYHIPAREWHTVLGDGHQNDELNLRNSKNDGIFIALWLNADDGQQIKQSGFDGFYTYFAATGFSYGSTPENWPEMRRFADANDLLFIASVGPGYDDSRIRPWNKHNTRPRGEHGEYFDGFWQSALDNRPDFVSITSFNEYGEGTQIEPSVAKTIEQSKLEGWQTPQVRRILGVDNSYPSYPNADPNFYLSRTAHFVLEFERLRTTAVNANSNNDEL